MILTDAPADSPLTARFETAPAHGHAVRTVPIVGTVSSWARTPPPVSTSTTAFITGEIATGRYRSASDVIRTALRLLEDRETQLRALRDALEAGERSGSSTPFDFDAFLDRKRAQVSQDE